MYSMVNFITGKTIDVNLLKLDDEQAVQLLPQSSTTIGLYWSERHLGKTPVEAFQHVLECIALGHNV